MIIYLLEKYSLFKNEFFQINLIYSNFFDYKFKIKFHMNEIKYFSKFSINYFVIKY